MNENLVIFLVVVVFLFAAGAVDAAHKTGHSKRAAIWMCVTS